MTAHNSWIYHFYLVSPQVEIVPTSLDEVKNNPQVYDYLLCLDVECNLSQITETRSTEAEILDDSFSAYKILWESSPESLKLGKLIQLNNLLTK